MDASASFLVFLRTNSIDKRQLSINFSVATTQISYGVLFLQNLENFANSRFRQVIEKQLNKVEGSNKFSKAISFGHSHEFIQSEKEDQEIAEGCRRLIKNAIVCWNYLYLSREIIIEKNSNRKAELIKAIRNGSTATWKHFNLHGVVSQNRRKFRRQRDLELACDGRIDAYLCHFDGIPWLFVLRRPVRRVDLL